MKQLNDLIVLIYDANHNLMRCLVNAAKDENIYIGNMSELKKFAKRSRQSNLLQNEIRNAQTNVGIEDNALLRMTKHCPTRYISELMTVHRFLKILIFNLDAL